MPESTLRQPGLAAGAGLCEAARPDGGREAALVGAEPVGTVVMMEEHDGAYRAWKQAGITGRILLHIDAHMDWAWIAKNPDEILRARSLEQVNSLLEERSLWTLSGRQCRELVHNCNYLYPALQEGIVKEFYWVLPDAVTESPTLRENLFRMLQGMTRVNPRTFTNLRVQDRRILAEIAGVPLTTCGLLALPRLPEAVLLDIDTDFLTADVHDSRRPDLWKHMPWIWPEELVERLREKGIRTDFATIAYSVEGGYTPLGYKYLGDEVALRLTHPVLPRGHQEVLALKRRGAFHRCRDELDQAIAAYERAVDLAPEDASGRFHLAYLYDTKGLHDRAAARYRQAVLLDPTYATAYNNFGPVYWERWMDEKAEEEYRRVLRWDPHHADARCGLAGVLAESGKWDEALREYQRVVEFCPDHLEAHRGLASVHAKRGMWEEAITELRRAIVLRPQDGVVHCWLGDAYARLGRWDEAIAAFREALRWGIRTGATHLRLGRLYLRTRRFHQAWKHSRKGVRLWGWSALASLKGAFGRRFQALPTGVSPCSG